MKSSSTNAAQPSTHRTLLLILLVLAACGVLGGTMAFFPQTGPPSLPTPPAVEVASKLRLEDIPFDGAKAYEYLKQICALGRRPSTSAGMEAQRKLLTQHFQKLGAQVEVQAFQFPHPIDGSPAAFANLIVHWHPERNERVLLCTHYDTLPYPLRDPVNKQGTFVGANDGGSGVAVLMALGDRLPKLSTRYGVDFAFFDGEEFIFQEQGRYFLGSEFFAQQYAQGGFPYHYRWGVLLDMVGDADLQIYQERNSVSWPDTAPLVDAIWSSAQRLGVSEFVAQRRHEISDDHLELHNRAGIPACDIIDFDYPYWHTQADTVEHCSALSLAKVGWVLMEWLK